jgi:hypothetical protein
MQKPAKNTKRLLPFALVGVLMLMGMGCGEDDTQLNCETTYDNTKIVEVLNNVTAKVIDWECYFNSVWGFPSGGYPPEGKNFFIF